VKLLHCIEVPIFLIFMEKLLMVKILVDADACPKPIKEILFRVAKRLQLTVTLFANHAMSIPPSPYIKFQLVSGGFDVADKHIADQVVQGDLVITADIPLASQVIEKGGFALNPRGEFYSEENIKQKLSIRNFMEQMRDAGQVSGGPSPLSAKDHQVFANALDTFLAKQRR